MPKKTDPKVKERCVRMVLDHLQEYPSLTAAAAVVAKREGVGKESVRRWVLQAQTDAGQRQGPTSEELAEIKQLKAKVRRLEEDNEILKKASIPAKDGRRAGDLLNRDFTAPAPNRAWVMDFTYVRTWVGFAYVAFIVDVFAQRIVAWNAATAKDTDLVMTPLRMAIWQRARDGHPIEPGELIGHADAGSQYTSIRFTEHLDLEGIRPSIGSVGDAYDNALMECIIGLFKTECIRTTVFHAGPYRTLADVEYAAAGWVDWYNNRRLHSTLGYLTPAEYEQAHYATLNREPQPA
jgi:putative transposase